MECCRQQALKGNNNGSCKASKKLGAIQTKALPLFSKINLRHHREELARFGYRVTFAKIETTPRPKKVKAHVVEE
jgi:hypothetical protein